MLKLDMTFFIAYLNDTKYASQPKASSLLPLIGPVSTGIIYCSGQSSKSAPSPIAASNSFGLGPFITPVITRYPYHKRTSMYVGTILCWVSLFAASYTTQVKSYHVLFTSTLTFLHRS